MFPSRSERKEALPQIGMEEIYLKNNLLLRSLVLEFSYRYDSVVAKRSCCVTPIAKGSETYIVPDFVFIPEGIVQVGLVDDIAFYLILVSFVDY